MNKRIGKIMWHDLTVNDAEKVSDFYQEVLGWQKEPLSMGAYNDFVMKSVDGEGATGVCHAKGTNAYLPPQWMLYVAVENLETSLASCKNHGGKIIGEIRKMGKDRYCLIQDPASAHMILYEYGS